MLADPAQAALWLRFALRWGIVPIDRTMIVEERGRQAAAALNARVQKAQTFLDTAVAGATVPNPADRGEQVAASQIAEAINELAAPEGRLAILSAVDKDQLANYEPECPHLAGPESR